MPPKKRSIAKHILAGIAGVMLGAPMAAPAAPTAPGPAQSQAKAGAQRKESTPPVQRAPAVSMQVQRTRHFTGIVGAGSGRNWAAGMAHVRNQRERRRDVRRGGW